MIAAIDKAFDPFKNLLKREVTRDDILKLTEKPVRRIYKLDIDELNEQIKSLEDDIKQVNYDLNHLIDFAVSYFENLLKNMAKAAKEKQKLSNLRLLKPEM